MKKKIITIYLVGFFIVSGCTSINTNSRKITYLSDMNISTLTLEKYQSIAEDGNAGAQNNLGIIYSLGNNVSQDLVTAYMWFNLASRQGNSYASKNKENLAMIISPSKITEASKMAEECLLSEYKQCGYKVKKNVLTPTKLEYTAQPIIKKSTNSDFALQSREQAVIPPASNSTVEIKEVPKKTTSVNLDEFKTQCQALGFKVGSADYGNCVLELNETK